MGIHFSFILQSLVGKGFLIYNFVVGNWHRFWQAGRFSWSIDCTMNNEKVLDDQVLMRHPEPNLLKNKMRTKSSWSHKDPVNFGQTWTFQLLCIFVHGSENKEFVLKAIIMWKNHPTYLFNSWRFHRFHRSWIRLVGQRIHDDTMWNNAQWVDFFHQDISRDHMEMDVIQKSFEYFR